MFQSLSRDSGRLNETREYVIRKQTVVSIPQSGFGAFELHVVLTLPARFHLFQSLSRDSGRLNPSRRC